MQETREYKSYCCK